MEFNIANVYANINNSCTEPLPPACMAMDKASKSNPSYIF